MSLYALASQDTRFILENEADFGVPMTLTNPDQATQAITGMAADIGLTVDPETGQNVSGRTAHVTLPTKALTIGMPVGVQDKTKMPWLVEFELPGYDGPVTFKVVERLPDGVGCIVCFVTEWKVS